eukprot:6030547-Ditylum_brightwellii.AAC.1
MNFWTSWNTEYQRCGVESLLCKDLIQWTKGNARLKFILCLLLHLQRCAKCTKPNMNCAKANNCLLYTSDAADELDG